MMLCSYPVLLGDTKTNGKRGRLTIPRYWYPLQNAVARAISPLQPHYAHAVVVGVGDIEIAGGVQPTAVRPGQASSGSGAAIALAAFVAAGNRGDDARAGVNPAYRVVLGVYHD